MDRNRWRLRGAAVATLSIGAFLLLVATAAAPPDRTVRIRDKCEPESFNAAVGAGTCVGEGNVTFQDFIEKLQMLGRDPRWSFDPRHVNVSSGRQLAVENRGGEFHTYTGVENFGGGFVEDLNELSGNPDPAPECFAGPGPTSLFLPAGATGAIATGAGSALPNGFHRFQCCVHPWQRNTVRVR
jgi:hypothetical protein